MTMYEGMHYNYAFQTTKTPLRFIVLTCFVNSRSARVFTNMTDMLLGCKRFQEKDSKITLMKIQIM